MRDELHAVRLERHDLLVVTTAAAIDAHHPRDVGPVDVRIHEADAVAGARERDGEIGGDGGFADAALAAGDGDDASEVRIGHGGRRRDARRGLLRGRVHDGKGAPTSRTARRRRGGWRTRRRLRRILHADADLRHALHALNSLPNLANQGGVVLTIEQQREANLAVERGGDVADHVAGHDVGARARVLHAPQRLLYAFLQRGSHVCVDGSNGAKPGRASPGGRHARTCSARA